MSDYLTDEEQMARLRSWWENNGTALIIGVVIVVAGIVGWRWYESSLQERTTRGSDLYIEWLAAGDEAKPRLAQLIVEEANGTAYPAFVLLHEAQQSVNGGNVSAAEAQLREAVAAAPEQELADLARLRLARVLFDLDRADEALAVLMEIRGPGYRVLAAELKGDIHLARGERALAHEAYKAALAEAQDGSQRPLLEVKVADTADAEDA